jgi:predicted nuclease with TOPRIM domain
MSSDNQNGWNEYSRLVLKELETLSDGIENLRDELQSVKQEIAKMQVREDKVDEIKFWKDKVDEIYSPSQMRDLRDQVSDLERFKTRAVTIFAVVQFLMATALFLQKMF